jgi:hypothetical protein
MMDEAERAEFENLLARAAENIRSEWEEEFVDSLSEQSENPFWQPSDRQWEKLEEIANR